MVARMESRIEGLRQFQNPYAPSVGLMGARLKPDERRVVKDPIYLFGKGHSLSQALDSLYGEAAERDALYLRRDDLTRTRMNGELEKVDNVPAHTVLHSNSPEDLGSTGCAAHNEFEIAARLAIFELVERHAVWLWWSRGVRPIRLEGYWSEYAQIEGYVKHLRIGAHFERKTTLFILRCPGPLRVAMAQSEAPDGSQIAIAFAAGETLVKAAQRATLELISVELETADLRVAQLSGEVIHPTSNRALVALRQDALARSHAHLFEASSTAVPRDSTRSHSLSALAKALESDGLAILLVDLSRDDINLPTCRAMFVDPKQQPRFPRGLDLSPF